MGEEATDEILLAGSRFRPTDPAFSKKLKQGKFIKTENEEGFLPNWAKLFLSIVVMVAIIAMIIGVDILFFISPMATLVVVAAILVCLIVLGAIVDGP